MFGPYRTSLVHQPDNGYLESYDALSTPQDVLVEATFLNPYSDPEQKWDHGFKLKGGESNHHYAIWIDSRGNWEHYAKLGSGNYLGTLTQPSTSINTSPGGKNLLQVVLAHGQAWVYINGELAGTFTADIDTGGDEIGIYVNDDFEGRTWFEDVAVWEWNPVMYRDFPEVDPSYVPPPTPTPLPTATPDPTVPIFGPVSGSIRHEEANGRFELFDGPHIDGDVMVEVTFEVPFAPNESHWNFGLWFDSEKPGAFHIVDISGIFGGSYNHWRKSGPDAKWQGRRSEDVVGINLQKGERNHIRVILIGESAWLYVNDRRMGILNFALGDIPPPDWVGLVVDDKDSQGARYSLGGSTRFEDFTVWKWHPSLFELPDEN